ncbi:MAG: hypothetical protein M0R51_09300 [Clostridia bacterium]|jgi:hypothetical protein|nr:hypothetical protein [Clostridia bacterium]
MSKRTNIIILALMLVLLPGLAFAGDEKQINEALQQGGTVTLEDREYILNGPLYITQPGTTLTGGPHTVLKVECPNGRWFSNTVGVINSNGINDIYIGYLEIDGNCNSFPYEWHHSRSDTAHDQEHLIQITGGTQAFISNIVLDSLKLHDGFSDGASIRFANKAQVLNCTFYNCQHESVFFTCCIDSVLSGNNVAAITSDGFRLDNCVRCKIIDRNVLFSYMGPTSAYKQGENLIQVGDAGVSKGYDARNKPTTTTDIEITGNILINDGLAAFNLGSAATDPSANVYIHDNTVIGKEAIETGGSTFYLNLQKYINGNYSYENMPTAEDNAHVFESIFDILDLEFSDSGRTEQTADNIKISVVDTAKGKIYGGVKIVGFKDLITIDGVPYIPDEKSVLVKYEAVKNPSLSWFSSGVSKISKDVNVTIENGTATATLKVTMKYFKLSTNSKTGKTTKKYSYAYATFTDSCPAPEILPSERITKAYVNVFSDTANPFVKATAGHTNTTQRIEYTYEKNTTTRTFMIGERVTDETGLQHIAYSRCDIWVGAIPHMGNDLIVVGKFDPAKLHIKYYTPYESFEIEDINIIYHKNKEESRTMIIFKFIVYLALAMYAGYKIMKTVIT